MSLRTGEENRSRSLPLEKSKKKQRNYQRKSHFECLERRELLAVAVWNNVVFPVDVNGDQPATVDPLDALTLINELNAPRFTDPSTGLLPKEIAASQSVPYLDVNCDGRISPLDVLVVINHLNSFGSGSLGGFVSGGGTYSNASCSPQLLEGTGFATELTRILKVPDDKAILQVQFGTPAFDTTSQLQIRDAFEIEITDSAGRPVVLPYQSNREAAYNWSEGLHPTNGTGTWSTAGSSGQDPTVSIDLTGLSVGTEIHVAARLVNNDSDNGTNVIIRGFEFVEAPITAPGRTSISESRSLDSSSIDVTKLSNLSGSVQVDYGRTSLSADNNELITELTITNIGSQTVLGPFLVVFEKFSELETNAMRPDGILPDGRPFIDFTSRLNDVPLAPGQSVASREIRFLNNSGQRFHYELGAFGRLNAAPSRFDSVPIIESAANGNYGYNAHAIDEDDQELSYSLIAGPTEMTMDSASGLIAWSTKTTDIGSHKVTIRATDPFGLFIEQSFAIGVLESLQNRPPNFTSNPVLVATASSGFEIATVPIGSQPVAAALLNGFHGNRLVVANAGDQRVGVYEKYQVDEYEEAFSVSTGEPKPNGRVLRSGIDVNVGLPPFLQSSDYNAVLGLDQGDFNGDGMLDIAALTYRFETWYNNASAQRHTAEIIIVFGDGDGGFSSPSVVYQFVKSAGASPGNQFKYLRAKDVNGDSHLDLIAIDETSASLVVILGLGKGAFRPATSTIMSVGLNDYRLVDLDQDGYEDIVGRSGDWSRFGWMKGNRNGTFTAFVDIATGGGVSNQGSDISIRPYQFADLNKDGYLDIVLSKYGENKTDILLNDGQQKFTVANTFPGARASILYVADFTGDSNVDILYAETNDNYPKMLVGDSSGIQYTYKRLSPFISSWPGNRAGNDQPIDIDGDGDLDIVFSNGRHTPVGFGVTQLLRNDGLGNFSITGYALQRSEGRFSDLQSMSESSIGGAIVGDYNRDGLLDYATLSITGDYNGVTVALGTRPGEFMANPTTVSAAAGPSASGQAFAADFNGDGFQDLMSMPARSMRLGKGDGTFSDPFPAVSISNASELLLIEDFNRDGILDILFDRTYEYVGAMGNGDGTFEITYRGGHGNLYDPSTIQSADFNNDGYLDFVARFAGEKVLDVYLYDPLNPGKFISSQRMNLEGSGGLSRGFGGAVTTGDFDGDNTIDLIIADERPGEWKRLITFSGRGDGTFELSHEQSDYKDDSNPNFLKSGDLDEDGYLDVVTFSTSSVVIHRGKGDGTFYKPSSLPESGCAGSITCLSDNDWGHLFDIDSDGHLDLVYVTSTTSNMAIRLGRGDGSFSSPKTWQTHLSPSAPTFADFDNDGHLDVAHATGGTTALASLYFGARDGLVDLVSADINGDGNTDVLAVNEANDRLKIFVGNNLGGLTRIPDLQTGRAPSAVVVADLNRDQGLEIITTNRSGRSISVFSGSLTSGYVPVEYPVGRSPIDVATGDFNRDQHPDVFVLDYEDAVWVMAGSADGSLSTPVAIALGDTPGKFVVQDANGDGWTDLIISLPESNRLLILTGDGSRFGNPQYLSLNSSPADVAVMDLNGDGRPDLVASLPDLDQLSVFYSRGGGQYASAQLVSVGDQPSTLTVSDLDNDGKLDIFVTNRGDDTVSILYNRFDPNEVYRYDADAFDPDGDALTYRVAEGPGGMFVDAKTGQVFWAASPDQIGQQRVVLEANDNRGGLATQSFQIDVRASQENAPPLITTTPTTTIGAGDTFQYQVSAIDKDRETLRYRLLQGPGGAKIDATSGLLEWNGTTDRAIQFNPYASAGYVEVPSSPTLKPTSVTVEGWFKFDSTTRSGGSQILFEIDGLGNPAAYMLYTTTAGKLVLDLNQATSAALVRLEGNFIPTLQQWYHFAFTLDDDTGLLNIFVDGELLGSRNTDKSIVYGPGSLYLGTSGSLRPHVAMDRFRVWNVARTPAQIAEGLGRHYDNNSNLVLDYRFEDQVTISVHDHSPAGNRGYRSGGLPPVLVNGLADSGSHSFVIGVEDGRGGFDMQSFELQIVPELRGSIAGQLFNDANRDGIKSVGELAIGGWGLYLDHNGNVYPDPSEPTATTDATGKYQFASLLPGSYPVRVVSVAGYSPVGPTSVSVIANRVSTLDRAIEILALGQIQGLLRTETNQPIANWKVFADLDLDALLDDNEPVATTDSQGSYAIAGLPAGQYTVRTSLPAGWSNLAGNAGLPVALGPSMISASNNFTVRAKNTSVTGGVHFVTTPSNSVEARQVFRYAALAINLNKTSIAYDLSLAPSGMVIDPVRGLIAWWPTIEQVGEHSVIVRATDDSGSIALHDFSIVVSSPNTAPVLVTNPPIMAYVGSPYVHDFAAQDAEESLLSFSIVSGPTGASIDPANGRFRWTPTENDVGQVSLTIGVKDASNSLTTRSFAIDVANNAPNALPLLIQLPRNSATIGQEYVSQIHASDGLRRPATWSLVAGPIGLTISSVGLLRWPPNSSDLGVKTVQLLATTADGATQGVDFAIDVLGWLNNSDPEITSKPNLSAVAGRTYRYQLQVTDIDRDSFSFSLLSAQVGMSIHPELGIIDWTPALDQLGSAAVTVQVTDATGGNATQTFSLRVGRTGGPPMITSVPGTEAYVGQGYLHTILTSDAEGDTLLYRLLTAPVGMQIATTTGEISWTPSLGQIGQQVVAIEVRDGTGGATTQSFAVRVRDGVPNEPPQIVSRSPRFGAVGTPFSYTLQAIDPEGKTVTYSLGRAPASMTIDSSTGVVTWTPSSGQLGKSIVTLLATDVGGASSLESFELDVLAENRKPTISSTAQLEVPARAEFRYDVLARDLDLDLLQYRLLVAPAGASIDAFGSIRWSTRTDLIGPHDFQVLVSDPRGGEVTQTFRLNVIADIVPPKVSLVHGPGKARVLPWQGPLILYAKAIDNVEVASLTVTINGQEIVLNASGQATFTFQEWGFTRLNAKAKAVDTNGNVTEKSVSFGFSFPEGWGGSGDVIPQAVISSPSVAAQVTGMVSISGTASHASFGSYRLSYRRIDKDQFIEFHQSSVPVVNGLLGVWDTTLLENDEYVIRLEVTTAAGVVNVVDRNVGLSGALKLGNFQLSFTDMVIPVAGIPIEITRVYDSLRADRDGDFGYGWRLEYRNTDLRVGLPKSGLEDIGIYTPFHSGVKVYLNVPGQGRQGFTFTPTIRVLPGFGGTGLVIATPSFTSDRGNTNSLSVRGGNVFANEAGELFATGGIPWNPASPDFGGGYALTTREGVIYRINGSDGKLESATDRNGNRLDFSDTGISSVTGNRVGIVRNAQGRIASIVDPAGQAIRYSYSSAGNLLSVTDRNGNRSDYLYDTVRPSYLVEVRDPLGNKGIRGDYDSAGRLISLTDARGNRLNMTTQLNNNSQLVIDELGNQTIYVYDNQGNTSAVTNALGNTVVSTYDTRNNLLSKVDELGRETRYTYDSFGNILTTTNADGSVTRIAYANAAKGLISAVTDSLGNNTTYSYDAVGNTIGYRDSQGLIAESIVDSRGRVIRFANPISGMEDRTYHPSGAPSSEIDANGNTESYNYDLQGRLVSRSWIQTIAGVPRTLIERYEYDSNGNRLKVVDAIGNVKRFEFDASDRLVAETDALGRVIRYVYDSRGLLIETIFPDATPSSLTDNPRVRSTYDAIGRLASKMDELGRETHYVYDAIGRLIEEILPDSSPSTLIDNPRSKSEYDAASQLTAVVDAKGNRKEFEYDGRGNQILTRDALGNETRFEYDLQGRLTRTTDSLAQQTQYRYDSAGRTTQTIAADGSSLRTEYAPNGLMTAQFDRNGHKTQYKYDRIGKLSRVIEANGSETSYFYDEQGNQTKIIDANGQQTTNHFDALSRRISVTRPLGEVDAKDFDAVGNLTAYTDYNGNRHTFTYNERNWLVRKSIVGEPLVQRTYLDNGLVATESDGRGTTTFVYDERNQLTSRVDPDGKAVSYTYDRNGIVTSINSIAGTTNYTIDPLNRIQAVSEVNSGNTVYEYDAIGRMTRTSFGNGTVENRSYDSANRLKSVAHTLNGTPFDRHSYTYDGNGNRLTETNLAGDVVQYLYDDVDRLVRVSQFDGGSTIASQVTSYAFDAVGNRMAISDSLEGITAYTYDANDRLTRELRGNTTVVYSYDLNGNQVSKSDGSTTKRFKYSGENRLVSIDTDGNGTAEVAYLYDSVGNRISRTEGGFTIFYQVDTSGQLAQVLAEYTATDSLIVGYVFGIDLISQTRGGATSYYHTDSLGSTRVLTSKTGQILNTYSYDTNGQIVEQTGSIGNEFLFAGQRRDPTTGLDYLRARNYDPSTGRFVSVDPFDGVLNSPISLNNYLYANSNPTTFIDPTGRFSIAENISVQATLLDLQKEFISSGFDGLKRASRIADKLLLPGTTMQNLGMHLLGENPNSDKAFKLLTIGSELHAAGFKALFFAISAIYADTAASLAKVQITFGPISLQLNFLKLEAELELPNSKFKKGSPSPIDTLVNQYISDSETLLRENTLHEYIVKGTGYFESGADKTSKLAKVIIDGKLTFE